MGKIKPGSEDDLEAIKPWALYVFALNLRNIKVPVYTYIDIMWTRLLFCCTRQACFKNSSQLRDAMKVGKTESQAALNLLKFVHPDITQRLTDLVKLLSFDIYYLCGNSFRFR